MENLKQRKIVQVIRNIVFLAGLFFICICLNRIFELKDSRIKYTPFIREKQNIDVLFFGTSHVRCGYLPMEMWDEYGIVSYNFGASSPEIATSYWTAMLALEYTNPKLIVFDISRLSSNNRINKVESAHKEFDIFPLSAKKIEAVEDLFKDHSKDAKKNDISDRWSEMLWKFELYHNRWDELSESDFYYTISTEKGAGVQYRTVNPKDYELIPSDKYTVVDSVSVQYLQKLIDECKKRDIQLLLTYLPGTINESLQKKANYGYVIAEENDVEFMNFMYETDLLNYETDFNDASATSCHLNASGAKKVSSFLGSYIQQNYQIPDHRNDAEYDSWKDDYLAYQEAKIEKLSKTDNMNSYLVQVTDPHYRVEIYFRGGLKMKTHGKKAILVENMVDNQRLSRMSHAIKDGKDYQIVIDGAQKTYTETLGMHGLKGSSLTKKKWEDANVEIRVSLLDSGEVVDDSFWYVDLETSVRKDLKK